MGYSRQYYYKQFNQEIKQAKEFEKVHHFLIAQRKLLPKLGGRKLYHEIKPKLLKSQIKIGRDKVFEILKKNQMLIVPQRRYIQTTMSKHWMRKYPNLIKGVCVTMPEQIWVSDITYIKTDQGNCYLNLVTDMYSRKIMGYALAESMDTESMIQAFKMAIQNRKYPNRSLTHHSDRGLQYCSKEYVALSQKHGIKISMTENSDPYENAMAERMNRTLKEEFGLGNILKSKKHAKYLTEEAVYLYNNLRPHLALNMKKPQQVH